MMTTSKYLNSVRGEVKNLRDFITDEQRNKLDKNTNVKAPHAISMTIEAEYLNAVRWEVVNLKEYATSIRCQRRLDWESFDPHSRFTCIYGQLYVSAISLGAEAARTACSTLRVSTISDKSLKNLRTSRGEWSGTFSVMEHYLIHYPADNQQIIAFLRGERDDFELTMQESGNTHD